jgi:RNA polymerase sigma factor (sigma-70 family)
MTTIDYPVAMTAEQNRRISAAIARERRRLANFIRRRVPDRRDADDLLQEVLAELVEAYRLMRPIEHVGAWLYRVARNRITDLFRRRSSMRTATPRPATGDAEEDEQWEDLLPSADGGPDALFARGVLLDEIAAALDELPEEQRAIFIAHEIEGRSFQELAQELGVSVNTLLARKHYAVRYLRRRLAAIHAEFSQL